MKYKKIKRVFSLLLSVFLTFVSVWTFGLESRAAVPERGVGVYYYTHIQGIGDESLKFDGQMAGTKGESRRLEAIHISLGDALGNGTAYTGNLDIGVQYTTHCQTYGWLPWSANGEMNGTEGESKRLEAIKIQLTGADSDLFDIYYRVHAQTYGWLSWAKNGEASGTAGQSKRLEGIQIVIVKAGERPADDLGGIISADSRPYVSTAGSQPVVGFDATDAQNPQVGNAGMPIVTYQTHVQSYGWQAWKANGQMSGTSGESKRLEGIKIRVTNLKSNGGGIRYITHVQTYGWQGDENNENTWQRDGAMAGTKGESKRLESIRIALYGDVSTHYDVYYRVHAQNYGWLGWAKNGQPSGTAGGGKRLEGIQIVLVEKGGAMPASNYGGYAENRNEPFIEIGKENSAPTTVEPTVPEPDTSDSDQVVCWHEVLGTFDDVQMAQAYSKEYSITYTDVYSSFTSTMTDDVSFCTNETTYTIYVTKAVDTKCLYVKYKGDEGFRCFDSKKQYFPDAANPVASASIECLDEPELQMGESRWDHIRLRCNYMRTQGYNNVITVDIHSIYNTGEKFDLYYKNQKVMTIEQEVREGVNQVGSGLYGIDKLQSLYSEVTSYKANMTNDELIDATMYWITQQKYEDYTCTSCMLVASIMEMRGLPSFIMYTDPLSGYPPYTADGSNVTNPFATHYVAVIFVDPTHYTIVEVQGLYYGFVEPWTKISQMYKISYNDSIHGPTYKLDVKQNVEFLDGYSNIYDMVLDYYGIDITKFDPFDCNTWW